MSLNNLIGNKILFFDGAMGTQLQGGLLEDGQLPHELNILKPEEILKIHQRYVDAGANIITTNTFGANDLNLNNTGYTCEEIIASGVKIAKRVKGDIYVALDIGPLGKMLEPNGKITFDMAYHYFEKQIVAGVKAGCDIILIETMTDIYEAKAAVLAAKENCNLPIFCTMTFNEDERTLTGTDPMTMVNILEGLGVDVLGLNCSFGPDKMLPIVQEIAKYSSVPVMVQPNAGLPIVKEDKLIYDIDEFEFAEYMSKHVECGASIIGGCCGTTPSYIKEMTKKLSNFKPVSSKEKEYTIVTSSTKSVIIGEDVKIIGESINPMEDNILKDAIRNNNYNYIKKLAKTQYNEGVDIIDLNVGLPEVNEVEVMIKSIKKIQQRINIPIQIDTSNIEVIEKSLRYYNGKPLLNSVNGKKESLETILPLVKKYGGCVIGLTLDEKGIPKTTEERLAIASNIVSKAEEYGINRKNIIIDCLAITASAKHEEVIEALNAIKLIKEKLKVKTAIRISNVNRNILDSTYLGMALTEGLDLFLIKTSRSEMIDTIKAFKVLPGQDKKV